MWLSAWPSWALVLSCIAAAAALAAMIIWHLPAQPSRWQRARAGVIWLLQSALVTLLLMLLWQPALSLTELRSQQNIVAFVIDASRSMGIEEDGVTREAAAVATLQNGVLDAVGRRFQVRLYRLDGGLKRIDTLQGLQADGVATHIGSALRQLREETSGLPLGAVVLLSDGSDNGTGIDAEALAPLRERHIPVHTVGFGRERPLHDIEIDDVELAPRALSDSRVAATVRFHQYGYAARSARLWVRSTGQVLASVPITFSADGAGQTQSVLFDVGAAGVKAIQFALDSLPDEENGANNELSRLLNVEADQRNILYVEGEPRWEYKFIRRAADDDRMLRLVSMLRTSENKIYRQNVRDPSELGQGFPTRAQDLFAYQGLIIGSVEVSYFTAAQQQLIREFIDRRGGGVLLLGGRYALADGGWGGSTLADLLPTVLPDAKDTFHVDPATVQLTPTGADSPITRLTDDPDGNRDRWKKLPYLMDYQNIGVPKAGASVLANLTAAGKPMPLLVTEPYGRGRTAELATSGTWRWQMNLPVGDATFDTYWQQLLRWLVTDSHGPVVASVDRRDLYDDSHATLAAEVRDPDYELTADSTVEAHVIGPNGLAARVPLLPVADAPGQYSADWQAPQPGDYLTEIIATRAGKSLGRDVVYFRRLDGVAESFHTQQNRELLSRIATLTAGRYWRPQELSRLADEIDLSSAGISARENRELWDMPIVFLLLLALPLSEWLVRRMWGVI